MVLLFFIIAGFITAWHFNLLPEKSYGAEDFGIAWIQSSVDFNGNGIDDYTDILSGAKIEAKTIQGIMGLIFKEDTHQII